MSTVTLCASRGPPAELIGNGGNYEVLIKAVTVQGCLSSGRFS